MAKVYFGGIAASYISVFSNVYVLIWMRIALGEWHETKIQGEGILFFPYGGYLKGFFFNNKINGAAFLKFPNGDFYEGIWRHGKLDGKCFKYFAALDRWALCTYSKGVFQNCLNKGSGQPNISEMSFK